MPLTPTATATATATASGAQKGHVVPEAVFVKLLDWPFLAFILIALAIFLFRQQLIGALSRGDILISWGENRSIRLRDLSEGLDEELGPIREDIDVLKRAVAAIQSGPQIPNIPLVEPLGGDSLQPEQREAARQRMKQALSHGKYLWRSIERLAIIGGVTESQAIEILRSDSEVILSMGKSQRQIAKLASRTK